ncbi:MAG: UTP--glucose-1-phosphate uridylyltransferase GalU [bacterium]
MLKKCLFPAAGYGSRFLPVTKSVPKELLPVLNKPLIQYGVEEAREAGMEEMAMVVSRGKTAIEDYFDQHPEIARQFSTGEKAALLSGVNDLVDQCQFSFIRQQEMKGLGHAILTGRPLIGEEPFAVILADDLCVNAGESGPVLAQMHRIYEQYQCSIVAIEEVPESEVHKYGVIAGASITDDLYQVEDMVEKPTADEAPSNLAIIGRYILTPDIFDIIEQTPPGKGGEIQITDALLTQAKQGKVLAYRFEGQRFDCGSVGGMVAATNHMWESS